MEDRLREALLGRSDRIEPPGRIERIVAAARARADHIFCPQTVARLGKSWARRLLGLVASRWAATAVIEAHQVDRVATLRNGGTLGLGWADQGREPLLRPAPSS